MSHPTPRSEAARDVEGSGPRGSFAGGVLLYERITDENGALREDLVRLSENPSVSWKLVGRRSAEKRRDSAFGGLLAGAGRLALRASELGHGVRAVTVTHPYPRAVWSQ